MNSLEKVNINNTNEINVYLGDRAYVTVQKGNFDLICINEKKSSPTKWIVVKNSLHGQRQAFVIKFKKYDEDMIKVIQYLKGVIKKHGGEEIGKARTY